MLLSSLKQSHLMSPLSFCPVLRPAGHMPGLSAPSPFQKKKLFLELWTGIAWAIQHFCKAFKAKLKSCCRIWVCVQAVLKDPWARLTPADPYKAAGCEVGACCGPGLVWLPNPGQGPGLLDRRLQEPGSQALQHWGNAWFMEYRVWNQSERGTFCVFNINRCHFHWHDALNIC